MGLGARSNARAAAARSKTPEDKKDVEDAKKNGARPALGGKGDVGARPELAVHRITWLTLTGDAAASAALASEGGRRSSARSAALALRNNFTWTIRG